MAPSSIVDTVCGQGKQHDTQVGPLLLLLDDEELVAFVDVAVVVVEAVAVVTAAVAVVVFVMFQVFVAVASSLSV